MVSPAEPLADLQDAVVSWETVDQLLGDLQALATIHEVQVKGGALAHARGAPRDLAAARAALHAGEALGIQIRYRYQQQEWCDTLLRTATGAVRLVRTAISACS